MPEWLTQDLVAGDIDWKTMVLRLALAAAFGLAVAGVFLASQRRTSDSSIPLITTLVLLTILVAMTTLVIGNSVARAFSLVGALSIVRFRTVVDDTRDTAFVIFAVVVGMAIGAGHLLVCVIGVPVVSLMAIGLGRWGSTFSAAGAERKLEVRIGVGHDPETLLTGVFREQLANWRLVSVVSARQGTAFDLIYAVRLRPPEALLPLVKAIHALDGVQSVELKEM